VYPSGERQRAARLDALPTQAQRRAQAGHQLVEGRDRRPAARVTTATPSSRSTSRPGPRRRGRRRPRLPCRPAGAAGSVALTGIYHHALAPGYARGFLVAAGIMLLALVITVATIRIRRSDLAGVNPI
jgi:Flp pilus assembly protein TadB